MIKRMFTPGTDWLYFKIYTGIKTADIILDEAIRTILHDFKKNNQIIHWFFIRYSDPKPHLRIRFKLTEFSNCEKMMDKVNLILQQFVDSYEISKIVIDSYVREIERYGEDTIENAELLFYHNSELFMKHLHYSDEEKIIITLYCTDLILTQLDFSFSEKLEWIQEYNADFKKEFNADKHLNRQLDKKYRAIKPKFLELINSNFYLEERNSIVRSLDEVSIIIDNIRNSQTMKSEPISLKSFFQSIFHMNINRYFISNQRLFEMIIYDYLLRYYKMEAYIIEEHKSFLTRPLN